MVKRARSSGNSNGEEDVRLKEKSLENRGLSTARNAYSLRNSTRGTPPKKSALSNSPTIRKSERLDRKIASSPSSTRKSGRIEKKKVPSPLKKSKTSETSSSSQRYGKSSNSLDKKRKNEEIVNGKREIDLDKININANVTLSRMKSSLKRLDARSYRAFLRSKKKKTLESVPCKGSEEQNNLSEEATPSTVGNGLEKSSPCSTAYEAFVNSDRVTENFSLIENSHPPELVSTSLFGGSNDTSTDTDLDANIPASTYKLTDTTMVTFIGEDNEETHIDVEEGGTYKLAVEDHEGKSQCNQYYRESLDDSNGLKDDCITNDVVGVSGMTFTENKLGDSNQEKENLDETSERHFSTGKYIPTLETTTSDATIMVEDGRPAADGRFSVYEKQRLCDGKDCDRSYHCNGHSFDTVLLGTWHCPQCVRKKIKEGIYAVSDVVEVIWDVRDSEVTSSEERLNEKQYLVKYRGLSHVHNRWISERKLLEEAPTYVVKFNRKCQQGKAPKWKSEWTVPQRLLQKRAVTPPDKEDHDSSYSINEWLVKWNGLGYEHSTWELETESFLNSPEAVILIKQYEKRHDKEYISSRKYKKHEDHCPKLTKWPDGFPPGLGNDHLDTVNKLREFWSMHRNSIYIDGQNRIAATIFFIVSLQSDPCQPFLILTSSSSVSDWEAELMRFASSTNFIVYDGNKDTRKNIRSLEFFGEHGCLMFDILLSSVDVIIEDFDKFNFIRWETIVVDHFQSSRVLKHLEQIKVLCCDFKLLVDCGQLKDNTDEYLIMLSFLDPSKAYCRDDFHDNVAALKGKVHEYIVYDRINTSKIIEYWVPIQLSDVQLEHYCATLLSNYVSLKSCTRNDPVGALQSILISVRKCCDHPYLVDESLPSLLTKDLPEIKYLDAGIAASGKLELLDKILPEIKRRRHRVLILFQYIAGSGRNSIGDILDDYLRQRFGPDAYERVDSGTIPSKKQSAMNLFNDKLKGRFVFLTEIRACKPSIKLSSIDSVILFDSDLNPLSDLRSLQKINISPQLNQIKIFRLYSTCTVEEKVLISARKDVLIESSMQNVNCTTSHLLLRWGVSKLFERLDDFHSNNDVAVSGSDVSLGKPILNDVVNEWLNLIDESDADCCSLISKVHQIGSIYSREVSLLGEVEMSSEDEELPHIFWTKLLEGRNPRWRYLSGLFQRARKKVNYFEQRPTEPVLEHDEAIRKRKKMAKLSSSTSPKASMEDKRNDNICSKEAYCESTDDHVSVAFPKTSIFDSSVPDLGTCSTPLPISSCLTGEKESRKSMYDARKEIHQMLESEISKLFQALQLSESVCGMAKKFLEYTVYNHNINREPASILQAFQISLCWMASSFLKCKLDHRETLDLARKHLHFACTEEEAESVYTRLRMLRKKFSHKTGELRNSVELSFLQRQSSQPRLHEISYDRTNPGREISEIPSSTSHQNELHEKIREYFMGLNQGPKVEQSNDTGNKFDDKILKRIEKLSSRRMKKIILQQQEEIEEFNKRKQREKTKLKIAHNLETDYLIAMHTTSSSDELRLLNQNFKKKIDEFDLKMDVQLQKLVAMQLTARNTEKQLKFRWLEEAKSGKLSEDFADEPLSVSGFKMDNIKTIYGNQIPSRTSENKNPPTGPSGQDSSIPISVTVSPRDSSDIAVCNNFKRQQDTNCGEMATKPDGHLDEKSRTNNEIGFKCLDRRGETDDCDMDNVSNVPCEVSSPMQFERGINHDGIDSTVQGVAASESRQSMEDIPTVPSSSSPLISMEAELPFTHSHPTTLEMDNLLQTTTSQLQAPAAEDNQIQLPTAIENESALNVEEPNHSGHMETPTQNVCFDPITTDQLTTEAVVASSDMHIPCDTEPSLDNGIQNGALSGSALQRCPSMQQTIVISQSPATRNSTHLNLHMNMNIAAMSASDLRNAFPSDVSIHPPTSMMNSRVMQHVLDHPLKKELWKIKNEWNDLTKMHEEMVLQLTEECEKEVENIRKKYNKLIHEAKSALEQQRITLETNHNKVKLNCFLAEAFNDKFNGYGKPPAFKRGVITGTSGQLVHQAFSNPRTLRATTPILVNQAPVAVTMPSTSSTTIAIPTQSQVLSNIMTGYTMRPLQMTHPHAGIQVGSETRAPPPHLSSFPSMTLRSNPFYTTSTSMIEGQQSLRITHPSPALPRFPPVYAMASPTGGFTSSENQGPITSIHQNPVSTLDPLMRIDNNLSTGLPNSENIGLNPRNQPHLNLLVNRQPEGPQSGSSAPTADLVYLSD